MPPSENKVIPLPRRNRDERDFLPAALEIIETPASPIGKLLGATIIAIAVFAVAWSCIGEIDIIATAPGKIVTEGKTKIIQPLETASVAAIKVADGDHVKAGDVLIELNATQTQADRDRFTRDLLQARLNLARLTGLQAAIGTTA
ncbi:MAG TPA: biotin/lipoyl-binding protein, partial [Dongiaceae bacterium]